jgi:nucleotide-binding universal stress UspA family protein
MGASLHVLHVVDNMFLRTVLGDPRDYEATALRQMQERVPPEDRGTTAILSVERSDEPAERITGYARSHGIEVIPGYAGDSGFDLIVMGTRGRGGLARLLMGSIAASVIRTARCPVVTVKSAKARHTPAADIGATAVAV